jgi:hypothetical protein
MRAICSLPGGWELLADADCSPWLVRGGTGVRYRPHELSHLGVGTLRAMSEAVAEAERAAKMNRDGLARAACVNLRAMFDHIIARIGG